MAKALSHVALLHGPFHAQGHCLARPWNRFAVGLSCLAHTLSCFDRLCDGLAGAGSRYLQSRCASLRKLALAPPFLSAACITFVLPNAELNSSQENASTIGEQSSSRSDLERTHPKSRRPQPLHPPIFRTHSLRTWFLRTPGPACADRLPRHPPRGSNQQRRQRRAPGRPPRSPASIARPYSPDSERLTPTVEAKSPPRPADPEAPSVRTSPAKDDVSPSGVSASPPRLASI